MYKNSLYLDLRFLEEKQGGYGVEGQSDFSGTGGKRREAPSPLLTS